MSKEITGISDFEVFDPKILSQKWFLSTIATVWSRLSMKLMGLSTYFTIWQYKPQPLKLVDDKS